MKEYLGSRHYGGDSVSGAVNPSGTVIALDLLGTTTSTVTTVNGGLVHVANSVAAHAELGGSFETHYINLTPIAGRIYTLTVGSVVLTTTALGVSPSLNTLVTALQADVDYAAAPFTVSVNGQLGIKVLWKTIGQKVESSVLTDDAPTTYTTVVKDGSGGAIGVNCMLLMPGERLLTLEQDKVLSFIKATGASDGIIRITYCQ